jgi:hypothetical protein
MSTEWIQIVSSVGFPIAVASYLLFRMERIMTELRDSIRDLNHGISGLPYVNDSRGRRN